VYVESLEAWQGTPRDEMRTIGDLVGALSNTLDQARRDAPVALAVKRPEVPVRKPTAQYDQKTRAEGAAMIAAASQGCRYFAYRKSQLAPGDGHAAQAARHASYPSDSLGRDAVAAACAALARLLHERERGD
jgi:hypothetical protein